MAPPRRGAAAFRGLFVSALSLLLLRRPAEDAGSCFVAGRILPARPGALAARQHSVVARPVWEVCQNAQHMDGAIEDGGIVLVSFTTATCKPCKQMESKVTELSEMYPTMRFINVMTDKVTWKVMGFIGTKPDPEGKALFRREGVRKVPTYFVYKDRVKIDEIQGGNKYDKLAITMAKLAASGASPVQEIGIEETLPAAEASPPPQKVVAQPSPESEDLD